MRGAAPKGPVAVLDRACEALRALDTEGLVALYTEDAVFEEGPSGRTWKGREQIRRMLEELFTAPGAAFSEVRARDAGAWGVLEWTWSHRDTRDGEPTRTPGISLLEFKGGLLARETIYFDPRRRLP